MEAANAGPGPVVLLTGLPGVGKTTVGRALVARLRDGAAAAELLDGDELRARLPPRLGFSRPDREAQAARAQFIADLLSRNGVTVVVALVAPYRASRARLRQAFGDRFVEVHLKAPLSVCVARDTAGVYRAARERGDDTFADIVGPYEPPERPELVLDTSRAGVEASVDAILPVLAPSLGATTS